MDLLLPAAGRRSGLEESRDVGVPGPACSRHPARTSRFLELVRLVRERLLLSRPDWRTDRSEKWDRSASVIARGGLGARDAGDAATHDQRTRWRRTSSPRSAHNGIVLRHSCLRREALWNHR